MKIKKLLAIICVFSVALTSMLNMSFAEINQGVSVEAENVSIEKGTTDVSLNVNLTNNVGIATIGFDVGYDDSVMTLSSVECGDVFISSEMTPGDLSSNPYMVSMMRTSGNVTNNGTIVVLHFVLSSDCKDGVYPITIGNGGMIGGCSNINEEVVDMSLTSGSITVGNGQIEPDTKNDSTATTETTTTSSTTESTETTTTSTTTESTETTTTSSTTELTETTTTSSTTELTETTTTSTTTESTETTTSSITVSTETTTKHSVETTETTTAETTEVTTSIRYRVSSGGGGGSYRPSVTTTTESTTEITTTDKVAEETTEATTAVVSSDVKVTIGSKQVEIGNKTYDIDAVPYIQASSNSTMVPLRFVALAILGDDINKADNSKLITWDSLNKTATVSYNDSTIEFKAGSAEVVIDGKAQIMENGVKSEIKDGRMFIPFRALGNALGVDVNWDSDTKTAIYKTK